MVCNSRLWTRRAIVAMTLEQLHFLERDAVCHNYCHWASFPVTEHQFYRVQSCRALFLWWRLTHIVTRLISKHNHVRNTDLNWKAEQPCCQDCRVTFRVTFLSARPYDSCKIFKGRRVSPPDPRPRVGSRGCFFISWVVSRLWRRKRGKRELLSFVHRYSDIGESLRSGRVLG